MNLWDLLHSTRCNQEFSIYVTNAYGQNVPVARGAIDDLFNLDNGEWLTFEHLMDKVEMFAVNDDGRIIVYLSDSHYYERAETQYAERYVKKWDIFKPETRPWLHDCETEEYTDKYINKFSEGNTKILVKNLKPLNKEGTE